MGNRASFGIIEFCLYAAAVTFRDCRNGGSGYRTASENTEAIDARPSPEFFCPQSDHPSRELTSPIDLPFSESPSLRCCLRPPKRWSWKLPLYRPHGSSSGGRAGFKKVYPLERKHGLNGLRNLSPLDMEEFQGRVPFRNRSPTHQNPLPSLLRCNS